MLKIQNVSVQVEDKKIIDSCSLVIQPGELHVLMGPNGSGKSSFVQTLMGHPVYEVTAGRAEFMGKNLFDMPVHARSQAGLFLSMQQPQEIAGLQVLSFLKEIYAIHQSKACSLEEFLEIIRPLLKIVGLSEGMLYRSVNDGFSGGEKKRFELLQMMLLKPKLAMLDEIDSGVDVDGLKLIAQGIQSYREEYPASSIILVTHYRRILDYIKPDKVHVMIQGKIVQSGTASLIDSIETQGYEQHAKGA